MSDKPVTKPIPLTNFSVDHERTFLTWPHFTYDHHELIKKLQEINPIRWIRVCTETHKTGEPHVHAAIEWGKRMRSKCSSVFDIEGHHPNIGAIRSVTRALRYCAKDGLYTDFGPLPNGEKRCWEDILEAAQGNEMDWLRVVHEEKIQQHVAKRVRDLAVSCHIDLAEYDQRPLSKCLESIPTNFKSLCVIGKPGIGKTGWAMKYAPRPALLVKHLDSLSKFRPSYHKCIVFDDCDFKHLPRSTQLQIADYENQCQIHIRYSVAIIPQNIPRLFLCNPGNEPFISDEAIQNRRVKYLYL